MEYASEGIHLYSLLLFCPAYDMDDEVFEYPVSDIEDWTVCLLFLGHTGENRDLYHFPLRLSRS